MSPAVILLSCLYRLGSESRSRHEYTKQGMLYDMLSLSKMMRSAKYFGLTDSLALNGP